MDQIEPGAAFQLLVGKTKAFLPRRVQLNKAPLEIGDAKHIEGKGKEPVSLGLRFEAINRFGQTLPMLRFLDSADLFGLLFDLFGLEIEIYEDIDLCPQHFRDEGGQNIVHCPQGISFVNLGVRLTDRGDKNNRRMFGARALANQTGRFEPLHAAHGNVEENDGEFGFEEVAQGLFAAAGADEILVEFGKNGFQGQKLIIPIIDQKDQVAG